jgi:hypothetical protein
MPSQRPTFLGIYPAHQSSLTSGTCGCAGVAKEIEKNKKGATTLGRTALKLMVMAKLLD